MLDIPQQNPLKYGFSGIEMLISTGTVIRVCPTICVLFSNYLSYNDMLRNIKPQHIGISSKQHVHTAASPHMQ